MMLFKGSEQQRGRRGQAIVEFSLSLIVLLMVVFGILEFGRVLFAYSSASDSLRSALRNASILGVDESTGTPPYLDCADMQTRATNNFFSGNQTITIEYHKTDGTNTKYSCDGSGPYAQVADSNLENGDLLFIDMTTQIDPIWFRFVDTLNLHLSGQRTIIKLIVPGAGVGDEDFDGLDDTWETNNFGDPDTYSATDDPDGDGCNNGCEEEAGTDPNDPNSKPTNIGTDPDGDGILTIDINPDNCPNVFNPGQEDTNGFEDGITEGDACEDVDGDGFDATTDNCPNIANPSQLDTDGDGEGNACDTDDDGDGILDLAPDNCPLIYDTSNVCTDTDNDGIGDSDDNCPGDDQPAAGKQRR